MFIWKSQTLQRRLQLLLHATKRFTSTWILNINLVAVAHFYIFVKTKFVVCWLKLIRIQPHVSCLKQKKGENGKNRFRRRNLPNHINVVLTSSEVPMMIRRSATGKSVRYLKKWRGSSSPKNTMSGLTTPVQVGHFGTVPLITSGWWDAQDAELPCHDYFWNESMTLEY